MNTAGFHFAQPLWLVLLLLIPAVLAWLRWSRPVRKRGQEYRYADAELLPHLTGEVSGSKRRDWKMLAAWSAAWALLVIAMAGPRWDYARISAFQPAAELVVLLDISASMNIQDVRPSRLARAKQEIQDLLRLNNPGIRMGLVAFATVAHVVSPLTEDMETLQGVLPALNTELVRLPGSRLSNALEKASLLFPEEKGKRTTRHLLLITDGDFDEPGLDERIRELREQGLHLHVLGVGTEGGGPVPYITAPGGQAIISRLKVGELQRLAELGGGLFLKAQYHDRDVSNILEEVLRDADNIRVEGQPTRVWYERFYLPLILAVVLILYLFGPAGRFARGAS